MFGLFKRATLSDRQEVAVQRTLAQLRSHRRNRFRILACIDGTDEAMVTVRFAARFAVNDECDVIVVYVRPIDQGLHSGGLQVRLARQNMMDAGFELPGVKHLREALAILKEEASMPSRGRVRRIMRRPGATPRATPRLSINHRKAAASCSSSRPRPTRRAAFSISTSSAPTI
ncbi:MAG: universal stress protein [Rhizobiales bacterium]|nr:universal stress protein [Hyphomicrobiales bacterium]